MGGSSLGREIKGMLVRQRNRVQEICKWLGVASGFATAANLHRWNALDFPAAVF